MRARSGSLARWGPAGRVARPCASPKLGVAPSRFEDQTRVLARQNTRACFLERIHSRYAFCCNGTWTGYNPLGMTGYNTTRIGYAPRHTTLMIVTTTK